MLLCVCIITASVPARSVSVIIDGELHFYHLVLMVFINKTFKLDRGPTEIVENHFFKAALAPSTTCCPGGGANNTHWTPASLMHK